jgi:RHS repeat-associated protein
MEYTFTGQMSYMDDPITSETTEGFGLMFYNARWYDPAIGRFTQADSIVPGAGNSQAWDRYSYVFNNPLRYIDPSGHIPQNEICKYLGICGKNAGQTFRKKYGDTLWKLLWNTDVSWGSTLKWTDANGNDQIAMLILFTTDRNNYQGALLGINGASAGNIFGIDSISNQEGVDSVNIPGLTLWSSPPISDNNQIKCNPNDPHYQSYYYLDLSEGWWVSWIGGMAPKLPKAITIAVNLVSSAAGYGDLLSTGGMPTTWQYNWDHSFGEAYSRYPIVEYSRLTNIPMDINIWRPSGPSFPTWSSK